MENRANHPNRLVHRERWSQPELGGMGAAAQGAAQYTSHGLPQTTLDHPKRYQASERPAERLQMFMKPHEILEKWGPLDADREWNDYGGERSEDMAYNSATHRAFNTGGEQNWTNTRTTRSSMATSTEGGAPLAKRPHVRRSSSLETDEQLWDRKEDESFDEYGRQGIHYEDAPRERSDPHTTIRSYDTEGKSLAYKRHTDVWGDSASPSPVFQHPGNSGKFLGHTNLGDSILEHGVSKPIALGFTRNMQGKREVVGGHHRLAVSNKHRGSVYLPVEHYPDIHAAKANPDYT